MLNIIIYHCIFNDSSLLSSFASKIKKIIIDFDFNLMFNSFKPKEWASTYITRKTLLIRIHCSLPLFFGLVKKSDSFKIKTFGC